MYSGWLLNLFIPDKLLFSLILREN